MKKKAPFLPFNTFQKEGDKGNLPKKVMKGIKRKVERKVERKKGSRETGE